jgi:transposase-like protein
MEFDNTGRRVRSEAVRARIVAESLPPRCQVFEVARKHGATLADLRTLPAMRCL